jgi:hypothetical protein
MTFFKTWHFVVWYVIQLEPALLFSRPFYFVLLEFI